MDTMEHFVVSEEIEDDGSDEVVMLIYLVGGCSLQGVPERGLLFDEWLFGGSDGICLSYDR